MVRREASVDESPSGGGTVGARCRISFVFAFAFAFAPASGGCGGAYVVPPPPPTDPGQPSREDRPPLQMAVDPVELLPPEPQRVMAPSCAVPMSSRLARCRVIPSRRAAATGASAAATSAFDGSTCTLWNAGGFAPQSIMVDLGTTRRIDAIVLVPEMSPDGAVVHRVELSDRDDPRSFQSAHRIEAPMRTAAPVELPFPRPERARFVQIASEASPSWIAWREIVLLDCSGD